MTPAYIRIVRTWKDITSRRREARILLGCEVDIDLACDSASHLVLNREHALEFAFIGVGPQMAISPPIDELRGDLHSRAVPDHRALEDRVHSELSSDFRDLFLRPSITHH